MNALRHDNNFDALRLFAAGMVIYGHGWILSTDTGPGFWGVPFARIGLDIFFAISGYMVTGSWVRTPRLGPFLTKRALRIFPGLIACVLATAYIMGPRLTRLPVWEYLHNGNVLKYLENIRLFQRLYLPGVFEDCGSGGRSTGRCGACFRRCCVT